MKIKIGNIVEDKEAKYVLILLAEDTKNSRVRCFVLANNIYGDINCFVWHSVGYLEKVFKDLGT